MMGILQLVGYSLILATEEAPRPDVLECQEFQTIYQFVVDQHIRFHVDQKLDREKIFKSAMTAVPETLRSLGYYFLAANFEKLELPKLIAEIDAAAVCEKLSTSLYRASFLKSYTRQLDPYSDFYINEELDTKSSAVDGEFVGVGIGTDRLREYLLVTEVVEGGPADGKLKVGDKILQIDNHDVKGLSEMEVRSRIRGAIGTRVNFNLERESNLTSVSVIRGKVQQKSVSAEWVDDKVLMLRVYRFYRQTPLEVELALQKAGSKVKGVILDLRNNPGGLLQAARDLVDTFISSGVVVYLKGRDFEDQVWALNDGGRTNVPLVVLVNEGTASAAEIVAGALQDYGRALVVGQRTYGKGSVQNIYETQAALGLNYRGGFKLTTLFYYLPSGRNVKRLEPDVFSTEAEHAELEHPEMPYQGPDQISVMKVSNERGWAAQKAKARLNELNQGPSTATSEQLGRELMLKMLANSAERSN